MKFGKVEFNDNPIGLEGISKNEFSDMYLKTLGQKDLDVAWKWLQKTLKLNARTNTNIPKSSKNTAASGGNNVPKVGKRSTGKTASKKA